MLGANILTLCGGIALFLYGMLMMRQGLEEAAGEKMRMILGRMTTNRLRGVLSAAAITALVQSSTAITVMAVGFVNAGMMTLEQSVWIIMGANIGTTITGQLVALQINAAAPVLALFGVLLLFFAKKEKLRRAGSILAGLGVLFIGMNTMEQAMVPLQHCQPFLNLASYCTNPFFGIFCGTVFTAAIQSSSASVGILQAMVQSRVMGIESAVYIIFGQNLGTCFLSMLSAAGTGKNAKRTALVHLLFNLAGVVLFLGINRFLPFTEWIKQLTPASPAAQVANVHTAFNLITAIGLLPFGTMLAEWSCHILPDKDGNKKINIF